MTTSSFPSMAEASTTLPSPGSTSVISHAFLVGYMPPPASLPPTGRTIKLGAKSSRISFPFVTDRGGDAAIMAAMQISMPTLSSPSSSPSLRSPPGAAPRALSRAAFARHEGLHRGAFQSWSAGVSASSRAGGEHVPRVPAVRSSLEIAGPTVGTVTEVNKDTFWPLVEAFGDKVVVLDMYTQWCGPCKVMAPKFQELSEKYLDVLFLKLDCNQENKALAKELGIRVVPTFKILKGSKVVKEVTGAKFDDLVLAVESVRSS